MSEHEDTGAGGPGAQASPHAPDETRELLLMRAGGQAFAVRADEADGPAQRCPRPTPLPHAPRAVLGVVCVRGRMRTVLDPLALVDARTESDAADGAEREAARGGETQGVEAPHVETAHDEEARPLVVALRGDEQLALAVERVEGTVLVPAGALAPPPRPAPPLRATLEHEGTRVHVLDPSQLFDAAMRGTERRRPRAVNRES